MTEAKIGVTSWLGFDEVLEETEKNNVYNMRRRLLRLHDAFTKYAQQFYGQEENLPRKVRLTASEKDERVYLTMKYPLPENVELWDSTQANELTDAAKALVLDG
jgi:hypothetical protein